MSTTSKNSGNCKKCQRKHCKDPVSRTRNQGIVRTIPVIWGQNVETGEPEIDITSMIGEISEFVDFLKLTSCISQAIKDHEQRVITAIALALEKELAQLNPQPPPPGYCQMVEMSNVDITIDVKSCTSPSTGQPLPDDVNVGVKMDIKVGTVPCP